MSSDKVVKPRNTAISKRRIRLSNYLIMPTIVAYERWRVNGTRENYADHMIRMGAVV